MKDKDKDRNKEKDKNKNKNKKIQDEIITIKFIQKLIF
jgi:hypothetical protein